MNTKKPYRRKLLNFSINRSMQLRMIGRISCILFICLLLSSAVYFHFASQEIGASFKMFHIKARSFLDMLLPVVAASFAVSLLCGVVASLFFPKNYAGALYRIEEDLKKVIETSDLRVRVQLRDGDQAMLLAEQVNLLLDDYCSRVNKSQQILQQLKAACEQGVGVSPEELENLRGQLETQLGSLKT